MRARDPKLESARPWWRRFTQFSLKSMLILMALLSVPLAGYVWLRERARRQAEGVALVESVGGIVTYEYVDGEYSRTERPLADWQVRWFGKDFFLNVVDVSQWTGQMPLLARYGMPTEADIKVEPAEAKTFWEGVSRFHRLQELSVYRDWGAYGHPKVTLGKFTDLRDLQIEETELTDEDLAGLDHLDKLQRVFLEKTHAGDETARRLSRCHSLTRLDLGRTKLTDEGLKLLSACERLEWLSLEDTAITDAGIAYLSRLSRLEVLRLGSTKISDR